MLLTLANLSFRLCIKLL